MEEGVAGSEFRKSAWGAEGGEFGVRRPRWHLRQVLTLLTGLRGLLSASTRVMLWAPWQSLQRAARLRPRLVDLAVVAGAGRFHSRRGFFAGAFLLGLSWQEPHSPTMSFMKAGVSVREMAWAVWQPEQTGALVLLSARSVPWMLRRRFRRRRCSSGRRFPGRGCGGSWSPGSGG